MTLHTRKFKIAFHSHDKLLSADLDFIELFKCAVRAMRFSYDITIDPEMSKLLSNGTWTGLIGKLNRTEVDYAPEPFVVTEERWPAAAFNYPFYVDDIIFTTRKPTYSPEMVAIFRTLSLPVWLSLLASIVLVTLVCLATMKYRYTLEDITFHVLAIGLNQQGSIVPKKAGEFLLLGTWMLVMTVFTCCFKSVLLSFLSFPPLISVRTVPELATAIRAGTYSAMSRKGNYLPIYLQGSPNEDIRLIGENISKNPPGEVHDLLNKSLKDSNVALVSPRSYTSFVKEKVFVSKDSMGNQFDSTAVSKDFCCKDEVDMVAHWFLATGMDQKVNDFVEFKDAFKIFSEMPDDNKLRKITLIDISVAFILLVVGNCLSVAILLIELWMKKRGTINRNKIRVTVKYWCSIVKFV